MLEGFSQGPVCYFLFQSYGVASAFVFVPSSYGQCPVFASVYHVFLASPLCPSLLVMVIITLFIHGTSFNKDYKKIKI